MGNNKGINSQIEGLTIEIVGNDSINGNGWSLVELYNSATILGGGTLTVTNLAPDNAIICHKPLTIKNCTINATSNQRAIVALNSATITIDSAFVKAIGADYGFYTYTSDFTINNSTVIAKGANNGSISSFGNIILNGCVFSKPMDAQILNGAGVCNADGNLINDTVKIVPGKSYDLWVWGTQVTTINYNNLAAVAGASEGSMTYVDSIKTLTLENLKIDKSGNKNIIKSSIDGLKIEVLGENNLKNAGWSIIDVSENTTIQGSGTLNIENTQNNLGINVAASSTLTIKDCKLNVSSFGAGIRGWGSEYLVFDSATVIAKGYNNGSIVGFEDITFVNCGIAQPAEAVFYSWQQSICDLEGNVIKDTVKILPGKYYDLWIWGKQVTVDNCDNLANIAGAVEGSMTYVDSIKTLTLENLKIDKSGNRNIIRSRIDGLKIEVVGENDLKNNGWSIIDVSENTTIQGSDTLNIGNSSDNIGININVATLTIKDCHLNVISHGKGIRGGSDASLIFDNATAMVKGANSGSIIGFKYITFADCGIAKPAGARFNIWEKAICDDEGNIIKDTIKIEPGIVNNYYDLLIWGTQVTEDNCGNLAAIAGATEGSMIYNNLTKTLTLENLKIDTLGNKNIIKSGIDGLIMEIVGENNLKNSGWSLIDVSKNTTIQGSGTLNIENIAYDYGINVTSSSTLTIKDCHLNVISPEIGVYGNDNGELIFDNATVMAKGISSGSIIRFANMTFNGCFIYQPAGAEFNAAQRAICNTLGNIITDTVKIAPTYVISFNSNGGTAVDNVTVNHGDKLTEPEAPTKEGYTFIGWFTDTELQNEYDFNLAVTSSFTLYAKWDINSYAVTIAEGITNGSLSFIPASPVVFSETVTITASADDGYKLKDGSLRAYKTGEETEEVPLNGMTFEMPAFDVTITAEFEEIPIEQFTIAFATPENGTISVMLDTIALVSGDKVDKNSEITITATPDNGYKLKTLTVNGNPFESGNTHIVVADVNIVAEFVETSIEDFAAQGITIYPNPVQDILHIKADETITAVSIYNMQGAIVVQNTGDVREINISSLPAAIYMLRVEMGESASIMQIIKE